MPIHHLSTDLFPKCFGLAKQPSMGDNVNNGAFNNGALVGGGVKIKKMYSDILWHVPTISAKQTIYVMIRVGMSCVNSLQ
jgi:hypothetical protein